MWTHSIREVRNWVTAHEDKLKCNGTCHKPLSEVDWYIDSYPHSGGIHVIEYGGKHWIYVHCVECGYETALWKLLQQLRINEDTTVKLGDTYEG